jgi:hypothetical protein
MAPLERTAASVERYQPMRAALAPVQRVRIDARAEVMAALVTGLG